MKTIFKLFSLTLLLLASCDTNVNDEDIEQAGFFIENDKESKYVHDVVYYRIDGSIMINGHNGARLIMDSGHIGASSLQSLTLQAADDGLLILNTGLTGGIHIGSGPGNNEIEVYEITTFHNSANVAVNSSPNDPTPADIPAGYCRPWLNTTTGEAHWFMNDGGVIKQM